MISRMQLTKFHDFIGRQTIMFGAGVVALGFVSFFFDFLVAISIQRFFMASSIVATGEKIPLNIPLQAPVMEGVALVVFGLFRAFMTWCNGYISGLCQVGFEVEKRRSISSWALEEGGQEIGRIMTYFNDVVIGSAVSITNIFVTISKSVFLVSVFGVLCFYAPILTVFVLFLVIVFAPLQIVMDRCLGRNSSIIQSSLARAVSTVSRAVKNNLYISLHNLIKNEIFVINQELDDYARSSSKYYLFANLRTVIPQGLGIISVVLIVLLGKSYFVGDVASLVAYLYLVMRFFQILSDIGRISANLRSNYPRISLLYKWWDENISGGKVEKQVSTDDIQGRDLVGWRAEGLSFVWPNGKETAIRDLNFRIEPGNIAMISGPSGAGKTTLFHLLLGLLSPSSGHLEMVRQSGEIEEVRGRIDQVISYVGSDPFMIAGTVRDQLLSGHIHADDLEIENVLRRVHADFVFDFKDGLNHVLTEQGQGLSAGQKQRLALARALLRKPSVLLLDEATANLDQKTETGIVHVINSLKGQMTIVVVSHRPHPDLLLDVVIPLDVSFMAAA